MSCWLGNQSTASIYSSRPGWTIEQDSFSESRTEENRRGERREERRGQGKGEEGRRGSHHPLLYGACSLFPLIANLPNSRSIGTIGISKYHKSEFFSLLRKSVVYQDSSDFILKRTISTIVEK